MKLYNPLCLQKGEDLYVRYYETPCPPTPHKRILPQNLSNGQIADLEIAEAKYEKWLASAKEVKVSEDCKIELIIICRNIYSANGEFSYYEKDFKKGLAKGFRVDSMADRIEIVQPDKNSVTQFEPFAILRPEQKQVFTREDMIGFLDSIREYEHESGKAIYYDERSSSELLDIYMKNKWEK